MKKKIDKYTFEFNKGYMSFNLESLGIRIHRPDKNNFREEVIRYCLDKVNNQKTEISPQLLLANKDKVTSDLIEIIQNNFARNLLVKRKYLLKNLNTENFEEKLNQFLESYTQQLKSLDITFRLSNNENPLNSFGNSQFIQKNLEALVDLIITESKMRGLMKEFIKKNIWYGSNREYSIFKTLRKIEDYNLVIFDDLTQDMLEWFNEEIKVPSEYPKYMKEVYQLNYLILKCNKIKNFIWKNFPKKDYSNVYLLILNNLFEKHFSNLVKNKNVGFYLITKFLDKMIRLIQLVDIGKRDYYQTIINNKIEQVFRKMDKIEDLPEMLRIYRDYEFVRPEIGMTFHRFSLSKGKTNIFKDILNTILNLSDGNVNTLSKIISNFIKTKVILTHLKYQLSEKVWNMSNEELDKILIFTKNILSPKHDNSLEIIISIVNDKLKSELISNIIHPYKVYHFSRGVWDFPMDNNYFCNKQFNSLPLSEELNALYWVNTEDTRKELIVFSTKGKITIELEDEQNKLLGTFLPIQGMIIKYLLESSSLDHKRFTDICHKANVKNIKKVLESISDLIEIKDRVITFREKLPYYGKKNYAELFFTETKTIMETKIKKELLLSFEESAKSNICYLLKQEESKSLNINSLLTKLKESIDKYHTFTREDFTKVIDKMIKLDYIIKKDDMVKYRV